jgi:hypothetical protein
VLFLPDLVLAACFGSTVEAATAFWFPSVTSVVVATGAGAGSGFFAALFLADLVPAARFGPTVDDEGMTPRSSIFAYLVPAKEEARSKDTRSPQGPALRLGVEGKKYL